MSRFILSNELFKPIRIPFLPVPAIPDHLIDPVLSTPAKFALGFRGVRVNDRNIAGTTAINDIRDLDAVHAFKGFHELQNAVALPCSKVVHCETTVVLDRLESVYVASGEVIITVAIYLLSSKTIRQFSNDNGYASIGAPVKPAFRPSKAGYGLDSRPPQACLANIRCKASSASLHLPKALRDSFATTSLVLFWKNHSMLTVPEGAAFQLPIIAPKLDITLL